MRIQRSRKILKAHYPMNDVAMTDVIASVRRTSTGLQHETQKPTNIVEDNVNLWILHPLGSLARVPH